MTTGGGRGRTEGRGTPLPGLAVQRRRKALTHTSVQQLESLRRGGYPRTILRIASALGVDPEELMSGQQ
jgi:hypothetical protein